MTPNTIYWTVSESNISASDVINVANYTFTDKNAAYAKLYRLWGYDANPESGETRQLLSAYLTEHRHGQIILLEQKVFDYRTYPQPEPEPEPEEPEEPEGGEEEPEEA